MEADFSFSASFFLTTVHLFADFADFFQEPCGRLSLVFGLEKQRKIGVTRPFCSGCEQ